MREWRRDPNKQKQEERGMYSLASIVGPFSNIVAMICCLYGYPNTQKLSEEWVPLIGDASDDYIMDWENILSKNLSTQVRNHRQKCNVTKIISPPSFMSAYIMDAILFYDFPSIGWKWTIQYPTPIFVYLNIPWEARYHPHFHKIF